MGTANPSGPQQAKIRHPLADDARQFLSELDGEYGLDLVDAFDEALTGRTFITDASGVTTVQYGGEVRS
jgi:hypothetical protein